MLSATSQDIKQVNQSSRQGELLNDKISDNIMVK